MSDMTDPVEQALFMILVEHDMNVWTRGQVGVLYVGCPTCGVEPNVACDWPTMPGAAMRVDLSEPAPHFARMDLRQRTLPDLSDIHTGTRRRVRDLLERGIYPEDLMR